MAESPGGKGKQVVVPPEGRKRTWLRRLLVMTGLALLAVIVLIVFLVVRPTSFDLSRFSETIDQQMTEALGRDININGAILLVTGATPSIRIENVVVDNLIEWESDEDFARLESLEIAIDLRELLNKKITVDDVTIHGLSVTLERNSEGQGNWDGFAAIGEEDATKVKGAESDDTAEPTIDDEPDAGFDFEFKGLGRILVDDIHVVYRDSETTEDHSYELARLEGSARHGQAIVLAFDGSVLGLPMSGDFKGGTLTDLRSRATSWPVELAAKIGDTSVRFDGQLSTVDFAQPGQVNFDLDIPKPHQLAPLVGELPELGSLQLSGTAIRSATNSYSVTDLSGKLGNTELTGSVDLDLSGKHPRIDGRLQVASLNLEKFQQSAEGDAQKESSAADSASPDPPSASEAQSKVGTTSASKQILPFFGHLHLTLEELVGEVSGVEISQLELDLQLNEDSAVADLSLQFGDAPLTGKFSINRLADNSVDFDVNLRSEDAELTEIIAYYTGHDLFKGHVKSLEYDIKGTGETVRQAWLSRNVALGIDGAKAVFQGESEAYHFAVDRGTMIRDGGEATRIELSGTVSDAPFELAADVRPANRQTGVRAHLLRFVAIVGDVELAATNDLEEPLDWGDGQFSFSLKGGRLDQLDSIYELNLPPMGPFSASGVFRKQGGVLELSDIDLKVGSSQLSGFYRHEDGQSRPQVTTELNAQSLQLNDFLIDKWSPIDKGSTPRKPGPANDSDESQTQTYDIFSYEVLNRLDAKIKLKVGEVLSGRDKLGHGNLVATLADGRLEVSSLNLGIPGGSFQGNFSFHPRPDRKVDWDLQLEAQRFELGVLARRSDPDSDLSAIANADLALSARGTPYDKPHLKDASGTLNFAVCPRNMNAGALDIWATNLVLALLPKFDPENESKVNCVIGRLQLENGIIVPEALGLDTTTLRVVAEGKIDLVSETYDLTLTPNPKRPQIFSLEMPLGVTGSLSEPEITMGKLPAVRAIGRVAKNTLLFPIKLIAGERLPEDGSDICPCATNAKPEAQESR